MLRYGDHGAGMDRMLSNKLVCHHLIELMRLVMSTVWGWVCARVCHFVVSQSENVHLLDGPVYVVLTLIKNRVSQMCDVHHCQTLSTTWTCLSSDWTFSLSDTTTARTHIQPQTLHMTTSINSSEPFQRHDLHLQSRMHSLSILLLFTFSSHFLVGFKSKKSLFWVFSFCICCTQFPNPLHSHFQLFSAMKPLWQDNLQHHWSTMQCTWCTVQCLRGKHRTESKAKVCIWFVVCTRIELVQWIERAWIWQAA